MSPPSSELVKPIPWPRRRRARATQYDQAVVDDVWNQSSAMAERDPRHWRRDQCGAWICRDDYGSSESAFGWWIADLSEPGSGEIPDLRAFHHRNGFDVTNGVALCHMSAINGAQVEMQFEDMGQRGVSSPHELRRSDLDMSFHSKPNSIIAPAINKG
jgi:hypothetical protein